MTEEEWFSQEGASLLIEHTRQIPGLPPQVLSCKYRSAAIEIVHEFLVINPDVQLAALIEATERLCEGELSLLDLTKLHEGMGFPVLSGMWSRTSEIAACLVKADAFAGLRGIAGFTNSPRRLPSDKRLLFESIQCRIIREIFGNPFRPVVFSPDWRTSTVVAIASQMYESRDFSAMPILADALQDGGCDNGDVLTHCRDANAVHVRGCWVVDLVLGKS